MKKIVCLFLTLAAVSFSQPAPAPPKPAEQAVGEPEPAPAPKGEPGVDLPGATVELGVQAVSVEGEKTFGFQQYRDVPKGAVVRRLDYLWRTDGTPLSFGFTSLDLMQRDMRVHANLESAGKFQIQAGFDGFSRFWGNHGRSVLTEVRRGVFTVPVGLRTALENATDAAIPGLATEAVNSSPQVEVRSFRERFTVMQKYRLKAGLTLRLDFSQERRSGNRPIAFGTFIRHGSPVGDSFETPGQELWEPTAYGTTEFRAALDYRRKHWTASVEYSGSLFYNHTASLIYQNPFRVTAAQATPAPTNPQPATGGASGGGNFRGRFADLQSSLPPDNQASNLTGTVALFYPRATRISALASWGHWTQNQAFLPYTNNPAVTVNPGQAGPVAPLTSLAALPQASLNGVMNTFSGDFAATTRPLRWIQLTLRFNTYDLDNDTQQVHFPGSVALLNSFWSNFHTGTPGRANVPIDTWVNSFDRKRMSADAVVKPVKNLTWKGTYQRERWNRTGRQADVVDENATATSVTYSPNRSVFLEGGFNYADRTPQLYSDRGGLENLLVRMFDQSNRQQKQAHALVSVSSIQPVIFSSSWFYSDDVFDKSLLGLHQMKSFSVSSDASVNLDALSFYAGWGYDRSGYDYTGGTGATLPPSLRFSRDTREGVHTAHAGLTGGYGHGKGSFELRYAVSLSRSQISTASIDLVPATSRLNSEPFPFPDVKNQFHELRLDTSWQVGKKVWLGFTYLLEPYRLNDFANDAVQPYAGNSVTPAQNDASRYYFLDAGPTNYMGHMATLYARFHF